MLHPDEVFGFKSQSGGFGNQRFSQFIADDGSARQYPQIRAIRAANQRIGIILMIKFENDIRSVEWTEKRYLKEALIGTFYEMRLGFGFFPFFVFVREAAVDNL